MDLKDLQHEISKIDFELLSLINLRASVVKEIFSIKNGVDIDYFSPICEQIAIEEILKKNKGPLSDENIIAIYKNIFSACLHFTGEYPKQKLIISSNNDKIFKSINEIFSLPANMPVIIAGPCAIENLNYMDVIAKFVKESNTKFIRGGAYKPRTSPYDFQGLREDGLKILQEVSKKYDLISVTEVVDTRDVELINEYVDIIQIGARNMQNYELLKEVGQYNCPVILKRGMSASIEEFIYAAEYIALYGNRKIVMCERGIRTFETKTRNTLDISSVPIIKSETSLPIIVDLSHSLGRKDIIRPIAKSVLAAGANGIMIEVHPKPELALSDSKQQLNIDDFKGLLEGLGIR